MYDIGDKVVYPMHGAGIIEKIEDKMILFRGVSRGMGFPKSLTSPPEG